MLALTETLRELLVSGRRGALATVVRTRGSTPQSPGARLLLDDAGALHGTVGGGAIEERIIERLRDCLVDGRPRLESVDLGRELGMCCGGRMEIFVERIESPARLLLFGAGHVAKPTAAMAQAVGFAVTVIDDREELNTEARFPGCERLLCDPEQAAERLTSRASDWLLVVTHDHHRDEDALDRFARRPHRYLGMIGSRRKVFRVLRRIHARGDLPPLENVYAPVGLDLGAVSPEEIAVSVVAELVALRHGKSAAHLRAVDDPRLQRLLAGELEPEELA